MTDFWSSFFTSPIETLIKFLLENVNKNIFLDTIETSFFFEQKLYFSADVIFNINAIFFGFAALLLSLKFLHKLASVYLLKTDGDSQINPVEYFKKYSKAIIVAFCFSIAYQWLYEIISDFADLLLKSVVSTTFSYSGWGLDLLIFLLIYLVFLIIIYIHMVMNGVRMFVLRYSMPLAAIGIIDNDGGIYNVFIKKIFQTAITVVAQIFLVQLSWIPIGNASLGSIDPPLLYLLFSIGILAYALKLPHDLNEIFLSSAGEGGGQKLQSASYTASLLSSILRK